MKSSASPIAALVALLSIVVWPATAYADLTEKVVSITLTGRSIWTPERLTTARPMPLPRITGLPRSLTIAGGIRPQKRGTWGGNFSSSRVFPQDVRVVYPYSTVGLLFFSTSEGDSYCSASVISTRVVLTAGHCLYTPGQGFHSDFSFAPAYYQGGAPFGTWPAVSSHTTRDWITGGGELPSDADFGVLVVADKDGQRLGNVAGWLGYKTNQLTPNQIKMLGYPSNHDRGGWMHQIDSGDWGVYEDYRAAVYASDAQGGSSGSPWIQNFGQKARGQKGGRNAQMNRVVGVTSFGFEDRRLMVQGSSILGPSFKAIVNAACAQAAGNCSRRGRPAE